MGERKREEREEGEREGRIDTERGGAERERERRGKRETERE